MRILALVAISGLASLQAISATEKSQDGENAQNASDSRALLKDNTHSEMDGWGCGLKVLAARRKKAAKIYKLLQSRDGLLGEEFGQQAVDRISAAMGQDRLMRLFQSDVQS